MRLRTVLGFNTIGAAALLHVSGNTAANVADREVLKRPLTDGVAGVDLATQEFRDKHFPPGAYPPGVLEEAERLLAQGYERGEVEEMMALDATRKP